jgi:3-deoxy-D-manno-octulosonic-acid transferase
VTRLPADTRVIYGVAQVLGHLLVPVLAMALLWRSFREPAHLAHLSHRFGLGPTGPRGAVWFHAASVGEVRAASPLIRRLLSAGEDVLITYLSPAGLAEGTRLFPDRVTHRYMPIDLFWAVRLFLARARPRLGIVMEIEIWPAMLIEADRAGVPMVMANGNLLERSIKGGLRVHLMRLYPLFSRIFTRNEEYRARYLRVGVAADRIEIVGEMKSDQWIDPAHPASGARLRAAWPGAARVLMIASSVKDEEPMLLSMVAELLERDPGLCVLWVPRSPQRFEAVAEAVAGLGSAKRSSLGPAFDRPVPACRVLVGDSIGEMNVYYAMADLVFVGGSLTDHGGHNILEPMALGRPVVMGPSTYGIDFAAKPAAEAGAFLSVPDTSALTEAAARLLDDPLALTRMADAARGFAASQSGAAERTYQGLARFLAPPRH